jgi:hypothetical protein
MLIYGAMIMSVLFALFFLSLPLHVLSIAEALPLDQIIVGQQMEGAIVIDINIRGTNYKTFWTGKTEDLIRFEAMNEICPVFVQHRTIDNISDCNSVIDVVLESIRFRLGWAGADLGVEYLRCVEEALIDEGIFNTFKSDARYKGIVESLGPLRATKYLKHVFNQNSDLFYDDVLSNRIQENDKYGLPEVLNYAIPSRDGGATADSSSTEIIKRVNGNAIIRYVKVLSDLILRFDVLKDDSIRSIAEIGVGFGGQAQVYLD